MHPAAWLVWATCAGLVTFTTTDPFYLAMIVAVACAPPAHMVTSAVEASRRSSS